ncbi:MAG: hypothetical protein NC102_07000 [Clostridium sp.]|nr:hypothetical protein [Clostridium sp.]
MWPFASKKNLEESGLLQGFTECHCHLVPGVDDGVRTLNEALSILSAYEEAGIESAWITPHIMEDMPNNTEDLRKKFDELKAAYKGHIKLRLASENMLDNLFEERLQNRDFLPLGELNDHLLVETSFFTPPADLDDKLMRVKEAGFFPLLAHPERYMYMEMADYDRLHSQEIRLQLNLYSLFGMYGPEAEQKAKKMLKKGMYSAVGTDTHRLRQLEFALHEKRLEKSEIDAIMQIRENTTLTPS